MRSCLNLQACSGHSLKDPGKAVTGIPSVTRNSWNRNLSLRATEFLVESKVAVPEFCLLTWVPCWVITAHCQGLVGCSGLQLALGKDCSGSGF